MHNANAYTTKSCTKTNIRTSMKHVSLSIILLLGVLSVGSIVLAHAINFAPVHPQLIFFTWMSQARSFTIKSLCFFPDI